MTADLAFASLLRIVIFILVLDALFGAVLMIIGFVWSIQGGGGLDWPSAGRFARFVILLPIALLVMPPVFLALGMERLCRIGGRILNALGGKFLMQLAYHADRRIRGTEGADVSHAWNRIGDWHD